MHITWVNIILYWGLKTETTSFLIVPCPIFFRVFIKCIKKFKKNSPQEFEYLRPTTPGRIDGISSWTMWRKSNASVTVFLLQAFEVDERRKQSHVHEWIRSSSSSESLDCFFTSMRIALLVSRSSPNAAPTFLWEPVESWLELDVPQALRGASEKSSAIIQTPARLFAC